MPAGASSIIFQPDGFDGICTVTMQRNTVKGYRHSTDILIMSKVCRLDIELRAKYLFGVARLLFAYGETR